MEPSATETGGNAVLIDEAGLDRLATKVAFLVHRQRGSITGTPDSWVPRAEVFIDTTVDCFVAILEIPGVRREDINVFILDGKVWIEGSRKPMQKCYSVSEKTWLDRVRNAAEGEASAPRNIFQNHNLIDELRYGNFKRAFALPPNVTVSDLQVVLYNGLLYVQWPRATTVESRNSPEEQSSPENQESPRPVKRPRTGKAKGRA
ncbi:hypothetical protein VNI00_013388 [Paramarasmius palmivorus]|uniref:SHSP domain-containing protein n=1 Tax=Paramarasmius palmivorus TaxID=297713 RepID=A0AAW0C034_9AGAR